MIKAKHDATSRSCRKLSVQMDASKTERKGIFKKMCQDVADEK